MSDTTITPDLRAGQVWLDPNELPPLGEQEGRRLFHRVVQVGVLGLSPNAIVTDGWYEAADGSRLPGGGRFRLSALQFAAFELIEER